MTYRFAAYSLLEKFKQLNDDSKISLSLAVFYLQIAANNIRYRHAKNLLTGSYLTIFDTVNVIKVANYSYITLPAAIMDLPNDTGINFIAYQLDDACDYLTVMFTRTEASKAWRLHGNPYDVPSPKNPYFYRAGNKIYLLGLSCIDIDKLIVGLYLSVDINTVCNLDTVIPVDDQHAEYVLIEAEGLMRFGYAINPERMNDGTDMSERMNRVSDALKIPAGQMIGDEQQQQQQQQQ